jgi:hypothetical protein
VVAVGIERINNLIGLRFFCRFLGRFFCRFLGRFLSRFFCRFLSRFFCGFLSRFFCGFFCGSLSSHRLRFSLPVAAACGAHHRKR